MLGLAKVKYLTQLQLLCRNIVFCSEELSCLPYKNQIQNLTLSSLVGKFKFAVWLPKSFLPQATFTSGAK